MTSHMIGSLTWRLWLICFSNFLWILICIPMDANQKHNLPWFWWVLRPFYKHQEAVVRLSFESSHGLYLTESLCFQHEVLNINMSSETLLWASRYSSETLIESSQTLYLIGVIIFDIGLEYQHEILRSFCEYKEPMVRHSLRAPLYYSSWGIFVFIIIFPSTFLGLTAKR